MERISIKKIVTALAVALAVAPAGRAAALSDVRWHNEATDTVKIEQLLKVAQNLKTNGERVAAVGRAMLGTPYVGATLEGTPEMLTVNMDEVDCTTFVEDAVSLARTAARRGGWRDFINALEEIRYRGGNLNGYASRLHYISEWAVDNSMRGVIKEVTREAPRVNYMVKTIDYMSTHRDSYAALKDSAEYRRIKGVEAGLRGHRFPYIKTGDIGSKDVAAWLREGDVVGFVTGLEGLDVVHMGMLVREADGLHVLHASSRQKKVVISDEPVAAFVKRGNYKGIRVFRLDI